MPENTKDKFYPLTSDKYRVVGGTHCPYCGSANIEGAGTQTGGGYAHQLISCNTCEKRWYDLYTLTGYEPAGG